jgi:hypothetical protein
MIKFFKFIPFVIFSLALWQYYQGNIDTAIFDMCVAIFVIAARGYLKD